MKKVIILMIHLSYWAIYTILIYFFFLALYSHHRSGFWRMLFAPQLLFTIVLPAVGGFYSYYFFLFERYLKKKKIILSVMIGIVSSIAIALISFGLIRVFGSPYIATTSDSVPPVLLFICSVSIIHGLISLILKGFISWYSEIKLKEELARQNYEMELDLIKSQINPHFLFNTINNIDVMIKKDADKASLYLNELSDMMRFMLYETKGDSIPIAKELSYIEKYIDLQKIRSSNAQYVNYSLEGDADSMEVAPMVFMPFIENAFKHTPDKKAENAIVIRFVIEKNSITFLCENRYINTGKNNEGGLGDSLAIRRLALLYPGRHELNIKKDEDNTYKVKLLIKDVH